MMTRRVLCALLLLLLSLPSLPVGAQDDGLDDALSNLPPREQTIYRKQLLQLDRVARRLLQAIPQAPQVNFILAAGENSINAGTTSGKIIVTEGMMHFVNSDDELAMILGHELAHLTQGHVQRGEMNNTLLGLGSAIAGVFMPGASQATSLVGQMFLNHFNQDQEREADRVGLQYAYAAGYDPNTAVRVMDRMAQEVPETATAGFFSSHPGSVERAQALHQLAAQFGGRPTEQRVAKRDSAQQRPALERDEAACERAKQYFYRAKEARKPGEKVALYQQGLRACPQSPRAHAELADAYVDLGDEDKAVREFRQTLRYDPHYPGAESRLHELEDHGSGVEY
jgi:predicted Zn-dependent protease